MITTRRTLPSPNARRQHGLTLVSLLFWGIVIAMLAVVAMRVFPSVTEYYSIQRVVNRIAASNPSSVPGVRMEFEKATQIEYGIESIKPGDLVISKNANDKVVIEFAYDKQVELFGPVYLLIKYRGKSSS